MDTRHGGVICVITDFLRDVKYCFTVVLFYFKTYRNLILYRNIYSLIIHSYLRLSSKTIQNIIDYGIA